MKQQTGILIALGIAMMALIYVGIIMPVHAQEGEVEGEVIVEVEGEGDTPVVVTLDKTQFTRSEVVKAIKKQRYKVYDYLIVTLTNEQKTELFNLLFPQVVNNTEENQAKILDDSLRQLIKNGICTKAEALTFKTTIQEE